ncbi:hypothetical protein EUX53_16380 [Pseudomonas orientalis]|nr:hypothetical protein EUX53_16380 [Pseudomonas orientalis]
MLAKNAQATHASRKHALSLTFFASKLAPTVASEAWVDLETVETIRAWIDDGRVPTDDIRRQVTRRW